MISQMHVVQNAARLAMADHRAADARAGRRAMPMRGLAAGIVVPLVIAAAFLSLTFYLG